jgi:hypothetical protein
MGRASIEVTVTVPKLIVSPLFRLDALATDFVMATGIDAWELNGYLYN